MDVSVRRFGTALPQTYPDTRTVNTGLIDGPANRLLGVELEVFVIDADSRLAVDKLE